MPLRRWGSHTWVHQLLTLATQGRRVRRVEGPPCRSSIPPMGEQQEGRATAINSERPMSEGAGQRTRRIVARVIVAVLLGIVAGYGIGHSIASDVVARHN